MDKFNKNDLAEVSVIGMSHDGAGVARADGYVLFVPETAVGDLVRVRIVKALKGYGYAKVEQLLAPSPDRITPLCPVSGRCGGCCYHHIRYEAELSAKQQQVTSALSKALGALPTLLPIESAPNPSRYRNKVQLQVGLVNGAAVTGFYRARSHAIVPCEDCLLQSPAATAAAALLRTHIDDAHLSVYDEVRHSGLVRALFVRVGAATGHVMVVVVLNGDTLPRTDALIASMTQGIPELVSLQLNINRARTNVILGDRNILLWGADAIEDTLLGNTYRISAGSFYQVNHAQCGALYTAALDMLELTGEERLLDLYCGIGTIGLSAARRCREVVGVEIVQTAVCDATEGAARNHIGNARFLCADATRAALQLSREGFVPDIVVLDPPRKGCDAALLQTVAAMAPHKLAYISCNPATLARDAVTLRDLGYALKQAQPFDMFPRTPHVETVALFARSIP